MCTYSSKHVSLYIVFFWLWANEIPSCVSHFIASLHGDLFRASTKSLNYVGNHQLIVGNPGILGLIQVGEWYFTFLEHENWRKLSEWLLPLVAEFVGNEASFNNLHGRIGMHLPPHFRVAPGERGPSQIHRFKGRSLWIRGLLEIASLSICCTDMTHGSRIESQYTLFVYIHCCKYICKYIVLFFWKGGTHVASD